MPGALHAWTALGFAQPYARKWGCRAANKLNPKRGRSLVKEKEFGAATKTPSLNGEGRFEPMQSLQLDGCRAGATSKMAPGVAGGGDPVFGHPPVLPGTPTAGLGAPGPIGLGPGPRCSPHPLQQQRRKVQQRGWRGGRGGKDPQHFYG